MGLYGGLKRYIDSLRTIKPFSGASGPALPPQMPIGPEREREAPKAPMRNALLANAW